MWNVGACPDRRRCTTTTACMHSCRLLLAISTSSWNNTVDPWIALDKRASKSFGPDPARVVRCIMHSVLCGYRRRERARTRDENQKLATVACFWWVARTGDGPMIAEIILRAKQAHACMHRRPRRPRGAEASEESEMAAPQPRRGVGVGVGVGVCAAGLWQTRPRSTERARPGTGRGLCRQRAQRKQSRIILVGGRGGDGHVPDGLSGLGGLGMTTVP